MSDQIHDMGHDFDGIEELDNDLPRWWLGIFAVTFIVSVLYVPYYHFMHPEKLPEAALAAELADRQEQLEEAKAAEPPPEDMEAVLEKEYAAGGWQEKGKADFNTFCMPCHAADGGGTIGPNFTDDYSIHGGKLTDMVRVITDGVPEKGMISWKVSLKPDQIKYLAFYVKSLRGTTPAVAKAAEGKKMDEAGNLIEE